MIKTAYYTYLGVNGTITSPVYLENIYSIVNYRLMADEGKVLTNGTRQVKIITVPEREVSQWREIIGQE